MTASQQVLTPDALELDVLCDFLRANSVRATTIRDWPGESLRRCAEAGVFRWFQPVKRGGFEWSSADLTRGYLKLASADLVSTFVITQYMGACRRIAGSENPVPAECWLSDLVSGEKFGTVGISHLTTSRRHLSEPVLGCERRGSSYVLNGMSPWVTGAPHADVIVVGATLADSTELLAAVPSATEGVTLHPGIELVGLSASCTDKVEFRGVEIDDSMIIAGPQHNVMNAGIGANPGGLQTSTLAVGLADAACKFLRDEASRRDDLSSASDSLSQESDSLKSVLVAAAEDASSCDVAAIRGQANDFVMRATSAALMAAKGAGYVEGHPVGKWCREALFFLVWSCPQPVAQAHLCELAGLS